MILGKLNNLFNKYKDKQIILKCDDNLYKYPQDIFIWIEEEHQKFFVLCLSLSSYCTTTVEERINDRLSNKYKKIYILPIKLHDLPSCNQKSSISKFKWESKFEIISETNDKVFINIT